MNVSPRQASVQGTTWLAYRANLTYEEVAKKFGVGISSVRRFVALYQENGDVTPLPPSNGYRRALSPEDDEALVLWSHDHPDWLEQRGLWPAA